MHKVENPGDPPMKVIGKSKKPPKETNVGVRAVKGRKGCRGCKGCKGCKGVRAVRVKGCKGCKGVRALTRALTPKIYS